MLAVLYLVFNEGYAATTGPALVREDIAGEAIRLARVVVALLPGQPEPSGLLALMLLQHSRRAARTPPGDAGGIVLLADQDRALWDRAQIAEALALLPRALPPDQRPGPYALQAAIAAEHARAARAEDTDWRRLAWLYKALAHALPTPVVELNRAVAVAMADGPAAGLELADGLAGELDGYHLLHATRADLLRRLGRPGEAAHAYRRALALATNEPERRFLAGRLAECEAPG